MDIQPFMIHIPQADLDDLQTRLERTRFTDEIPGSGSDYGVRLSGSSRPASRMVRAPLSRRGRRIPVGKALTGCVTRPTPVIN
jgi:hypothetical protein